MSALVTRLTNQLRSRGVKDAKGKAIAILKKRGHLNGKGQLTAAGKTRQSMGNAGRAKDRASKKSGKSPSAYKYNKKTNRATLKRKK